MGAWMRKTILFPRKRIASRALQEKSQVKTKCIGVGSCRLYAPMVPLAPHPCVRWWNTKMMPLKSTRLGLHSLRGGSPNELPPPRRRGYQRTWYSIPPTQRQWRKRDHRSLKRRPPETEGYPKVFCPRDTITAQIQRPVVSYLPIISTGLSFLFRSPEPLFLLLSKRKSGFTRKGYAPSVRRRSRQRLGCGPSWASKKQPQDKTPRFPTKEKAVLPPRGTTHP